jgi:AcrR family transcriptional regulator
MLPAGSSMRGAFVVGIDRLLEDAGVAKASLYGRFGTKDGLVRAYLEEHLEARREHVTQVLAGYDCPGSVSSDFFQMPRISWRCRHTADAGSQRQR